MWIDPVTLRISSDWRSRSHVKGWTGSAGSEEFGRPLQPRSKGLHRIGWRELRIVNNERSARA
eukprot:4471257-Alexandrium_andersonii.AAC.1